MKRTNLILLGILLALPLAIALTPRPTKAAPIERIYLSPSAYTFYSNQTLVGDKFNITAYTDTDTPAAAWQIYIEFNDTFINATRWWEPTTNASYIFFGETTSANPVPPNPGYVHNPSGSLPGTGIIQVSSNLFPTPPAQPAVNGTGKLLAIVEFNITAEPPIDGNVTTTLHFGPSDTFLLDEFGGTITTTNEDGTYMFVYNGVYIPEFPVAFLFPVLAALTLVAVAVRKKIKLH